MKKRKRHGSPTVGPDIQGEEDNNMEPSDVSGFLRKLAAYLKTGQDAHGAGEAAEELADKIDTESKPEKPEPPKGDPLQPPPGDPAGP